MRMATRASSLTLSLPSRANSHKKRNVYFQNAYVPDLQKLVAKGRKLEDPKGVDDIISVKRKYSKRIIDLKKKTYSLTALSRTHNLSRNTVIKIKKLIAS